LSNYLSFPLEVTLEITYQCNLRCLHCYLPNVNSFTRDYNRLSISELKNLITALEQHELCQMVISGGEPLLRKDIFELLDFIVSKTNILPYIVTNGTLIDHHTAKKLTEYDLLKDCVQVSIDGASEETHDILRGDGSYKRALQGVKNLLSYGGSPTMGFVITSLNAKDVTKYVDLAYDLGVNSVHFMPLMPSGKAKIKWNILKLSKGERNKIKYQIEIMRKEKPHMKIIVDPALCPPPDLNNLELSDHDAKFIGCEAGRLELTITPEGDVIPCSLLRDPQFIAGNVREKDIKYIWQTSPVFSIFRSVRPASISADEKCKNCKLFKICAGGCPATSYHLLGDILKRDAFCALYDDYINAG